MDPEALLACREECTGGHAFLTFSIGGSRVSVAYRPEAHDRQLVAPPQLRGKECARETKALNREGRKYMDALFGFSAAHADGGILDHLGGGAGVGAVEQILARTVTP